MFFRPRNDKVSAIAKTLAAACAIAHVSFFTLFAWRVIGRAGMGSFAWALARARCAARARMQRSRVLPDQERRRHAGAQVGLLGHRDVDRHGRRAPRDRRRDRT